jgi:hypothetical protein
MPQTNLKLPRSSETQAKVCSAAAEHIGSSKPPCLADAHALPSKQQEAVPNTSRPRTPKPDFACSYACLRVRIGPITRQHRQLIALATYRPVSFLVHSARAPSSAATPYTPLGPPVLVGDCNTLASSFYHSELAETI